MSLFKSWSGHSGNTEKPNSRRGLPSWFRPQSWRRRREPHIESSELSELDTRGLMTVRSRSKASASSIGAREGEEHGSHPEVAEVHVGRPMPTANLTV